MDIQRGGGYPVGYNLANSKSPIQSFLFKTSRCFGFYYSDIAMPTSKA